LLSPNYEIIEYITNYFNKVDAVIISYASIGLYLLYRLITQHTNTYKLLRIASIILFSVLYLLLQHTNFLQNMKPYSYIPSFIKATQWKSLIADRNLYLANHKNIKEDINNVKINYDKIVIIMGESVNRHHMGIYGYPRPTTPFLTRLLKKDNSYRFDNVISSANQTRYAVPIALTDATATNFDRFFKSKSLFSTIKDYGFKSYWLSNQFVSGLADSFISSIANETDTNSTENFAYIPGGATGAKLDSVLLDKLKKIHTQQKEIYLFHLLGSHFKYSKRYPEGSGIIQNPINKIDEYDNSIFYTDYILSKIFDHFKNERLLFVYLSDHAEVVHPNKSGHGYTPPFRDEYEIPLFIYSSEANEKLARYNRKNLFNTENFKTFIEYLVGVKAEYSESTHNDQVISLNPNTVLKYSSLSQYDKNLITKKTND